MGSRCERTQQNPAHREYLTFLSLQIDCDGIEIIPNVDTRRPQQECRACLKIFPFCETFFISSGKEREMLAKRVGLAPLGILSMRPFLWSFQLGSLSEAEIFRVSRCDSAKDLSSAPTSDNRTAPGDNSVSEVLQTFQQFTNSLALQ